MLQYLLKIDWRGGRRTEHMTEGLLLPLGKAPVLLLCCSFHFPAHVRMESAGLYLLPLAASVYRIIRYTCYPFAHRPERNIRVRRAAWAFLRK